MRAASASTITADGYRAGCELAEPLRAAAPEVILLFASIDYQPEFPDLVAGLTETLGRTDVLIIGGTGDGIYETGRVAHRGVCALGLHSEGKLQWTVAVEKGVAANSFAAAQGCARRALASLGGAAQFAFVLADGVKADGTGIVAGLASVLDIPFFGGLAGDDRKFARSCLVVGGEVMEDAVAVLAARGELAFAVNAASGWTPVGQVGSLEQCNHNLIQRIGGMTAEEFLREQLGKNPSEVDLGIVPLAVYETAGEEHFALRTPSRIDPASGALTMFGSIPAGAPVRVCTASRAEVLAGVEAALTGVRQPPLAAAAAVIVVSCAGRKWLLEDQTKEEVERVFAAIGRRLPLIGFPSFGEIGPFRKADGSYTSCRFHNVTYVVCLLGT
ncbi:MAG: FIST N-terminal domain-containing protein [Lentisphaeria bacterium]|jgi:hypothetical protein